MSKEPAKEEEGEEKRGCCLKGGAQSGIGEEEEDKLF